MALILGLLVSTAFAGTYPITVTDKKEKVFETPGLSLDEPYFLSSEERYLQEPNMSFAGGTNRSRFLQIRGVGEASYYENTPTASVGYFLNDIDLTGLAASWPQGNTAGVDVLKGPQSVFYGGSAIGGVVTGRLSPVTPPGKILLSYETRDAKQAGGELNFGNRARLFFYHNHSRGFYDNSYDGSSGAAQDEFYASLEWSIIKTESLSVSTSLIGWRAKNAFDMWSLKNTYETQSDQPGEDAQKVYGQSLKIEKQWSEKDSFISLSSVTFSQSTYSYDADWGNNDYWRSIPGWTQNYDYFDSFRRQRGTWFQKLYWQRGESRAGVHLYGLSEFSEVAHFKNKSIKSFNNSDYGAQSAAAFAEIHSSAGEGQDLIFSGRYERQRIKYGDDFLNAVNRDFDFMAAGLGFRKDLTENLRVQALITRGFKSAGVNVESSLPAADRFYKPEYALNYEVRLDYTKKSLEMRMNVFFNDQTDKQVKVSRQDDPMDPGTFTYFTSNAARVQALGFEASLRRFWGAWGFEARGAALRSRFLRYSFENQNLDGRPTATSPEWSYALGLSRFWKKVFSANVSLSGKGSSYFSNNHDQKAAGFHVVNAGVGYANGKWEVRLWGKNIFNRYYETRGFYFANEPPDWENKLYVQYGLPRRFGASLQYAF